MGSETVIQRISFRNSCGIFLRDFVTVKLERYCLLIFFCFAHCLIFLLSINVINNFKACRWFHFHFFLVTPGS